MKNSREVILRIAAAHPDKRALDILGMELAYVYPTWTVLTLVCNFYSTGNNLINVFGSGKSFPRFISSSILINRNAVIPLVQTASSSPQHVPLSTKGCQNVIPSPPPPMNLLHPSGRFLPLHAVCVGRSGDKGDSANIAIISRHPSFYPHLVSQLTSAVIRKHLSYLIDKDGAVERYLVPGVHAVNFVVTKCLGGGGLGSLRLDRQGKGFAQVILGGIEILVPDDVLERSRL